MRLLETFFPRSEAIKADRWDYLNYPLALLLLEFVVGLGTDIPSLRWYAWIPITFSVLAFYSLKFPKITKRLSTDAYNLIFDFSLLMITFSTSVTCAILVDHYGLISAASVLGAAIYMASLESISSYPNCRSYRSPFHYFATTVPVAYALMSHGDWVYAVIGIASVVHSLKTYFKQKGLEKTYFQTVMGKSQVETSEKRMRNFINMLPGYVSWLDQELKYRGINSQLENLIGKKESEILGTPVGNFKDTSPFVKRIHEFMESKPDSDFCEMPLDFEGSPKWYLVLLKKVKMEDKLEILLITLDIDEQKQSQLALEEQRAFAEHSSRLASLGEMAAGIAHEIRNPLTVISTAADTVMLGLEKGVIDKDKIEQRVQLIHKTVGRINAIVKSLSHFSRANNDEPMAPARLNDICEEALVLCREKVVKSGVEMRVENRSNCLIACHSHQIGQIIVNLVGNACDAVGTSPKKDINLSIYTENDFVKLEVWDSGPGVKDEAKLFRPFHTTKSAGKGTGLGLIISKRLVERHGGKISYKRENEKTCFTVELPLLKSESSKAAA